MLNLDYVVNAAREDVLNEGKRICREIQLNSW